MANHKSSLKRIRQEETRRLHNRYYGKTMRNAVRKLRATTDKAAGISLVSWRNNHIVVYLEMFRKLELRHISKCSWVSEVACES